MRTRTSDGPISGTAISASSSCLPSSRSRTAFMNAQRLMLNAQHSTSNQADDPSTPAIGHWMLSIGRLFYRDISPVYQSTLKNLSEQHAGASRHVQSLDRCIVKEALRCQRNRNGG